MGSFSLKNDDFEKDKKVANENSRDDSFSKFRYVGENTRSGEEVYKKYTNRVILIVLSSLFFVLVVNVVLFYFFSSSTQSVVEIPENVDFKEFVENVETKDNSVYSLVSHKKHTVKNPKIIRNNERVRNADIQKFFDEKERRYNLANAPKSKNKDASYIDFKSVRGVGVDDPTDDSSDGSGAELAVGAAQSLAKQGISDKILKVDENAGAALDNVYRLNIGVFLTHNLANEFLRKTKETYRGALNRLPHYIIPIQTRKRILYKVLIGDFDSVSTANHLSEKLEDLGLNNGVEEF